MKADTEKKFFILANREDISANGYGSLNHFANTKVRA